jgi:adenosylcobyric acid synthase
VAGVIPYMKVAIEEEDSLSEKLEHSQKGLIDLAVIRLPRMSNYTDFDVFEQLPGVSVRYVHNVRELETPDCICLPGSKNTVGDLLWMRQSGIEAAVKKLSKTTPVIGICGGFQMLGEVILDPFCVEQGMDAQGMGLLPIQTTLTKEKTESFAD